MDSTMDIMNRGINCLIRQMGVVEAEKFISIINREKFDYTKWQQHLFDDMTLEELNEAAAAFSKENPIFPK